MSTAPVPVPSKVEAAKTRALAAIKAVRWIPGVKAVLEVAVKALLMEFAPDALPILRLADKAARAIEGSLPAESRALLDEILPLVEGAAGIPAPAPPATIPFPSPVKPSV